MNDLLISVIVPIYNTDNYLDSCVNSILNQSYQSYELLLIDDGSTDNSSIICDNYSNKYDVIRVFHKKNGGPASARNLGLKEAKGDFITFIDADDWVDEDYLQNFVTSIHVDRYDNLIMQGLVKEFTDGSSYICDDSIYFAAGCGNLYNRKVIVDNQILLNSEMKLGEDTIFNLDYLMFVDGYTIVDKCGYHYRHSNKGTSLTSSANIDSIYQFYLKLKEKSKEKYILNNSRLSDFLNSHVKTQIQSAIYRLDTLDAENRKQWLKLIFIDGNYENVDFLVEEIKNLESIVKMKNNELALIRRSKAYRIGKLILSPFKFLRYK